MQREEVIIIGGGPCGMSCAIALQKQGIRPLIIEKGNVVQTIYKFPTHQTFFSSSEKLEIGDFPFITEKQKPVRIQALAYYREVAKRSNLRINTFENALEIVKQDDYFMIKTIDNQDKIKEYAAEQIVVATGYYDQPNFMHVPGEDLAKVSHYFKEGHPYYNKDVVIIGGKNSAVDAALELHHAGANITVLYRGETYSSSIKPWILPDFESLVNKDIIKMVFQAHIDKITHEYVYYRVNGEQKKVKSDFVFAMTGYRPNVELLNHAGVHINKENGKPQYNEETMESNIDGLYIAGVVAAGNNNNEIFIENGQFHGQLIAQAIKNKR
ncbi:YpdA family putative bacillithiol disulfide reductase [Paracerasibacillus soli]|uniref:YpdA family putative bacillithiol disulfide reductase n=1 Tax=Paracerasibacillus soli TaxID=480284 RepID=A0ABU5CPQ0_9BACI|nr:YpdA family putative bacillithiol disulfide reductase [Virgibacillus soli]MDY0408332.1 YpdA family putative bacillithiol disulfide reductase [Virgibacillus soli]